MQLTDWTVNLLNQLLASYVSLSVYAACATAARPAKARVERNMLQELMKSWGEWNTCHGEFTNGGDDCEESRQVTFRIKHMALSFHFIDCWLREYPNTVSHPRLPETWHSAIWIFYMDFIGQGHC